MNKDIKDISRETNCWMDNWSDELWALTFGGHKRIKLSQETMNAMGSLAYDSVSQNPSLIEKLEKDIEETMDGKQWFIRLNSRSPKDYIHPCIGNNAQSVMEMLLGSLRIIDDICGMLHYKVDGYIYFRPVVNIPNGSEFRAFVKDSKLIGITMYETTTAKFHYEQKDFIINAIKELAPKVIPTYPDKDFVFDVYFDDYKNITLLEVNPYGMSDPCYFGDYESIEKGGYAYYDENKLIHNEPFKE